jgi:ABC-type lipoprotein export system ATPase subunit
MPGVARAANVTYLTMQVRQGERDVRAMVVGVAPGRPGEPGQPAYLVAGRHITRSHYEAVADIAAGLRSASDPDPPQRLHRRRPDPAHGVLQRRPDGLHPAQGRAGGAVPQGQRRHLQQRRRTAQNPAFNRPGVPGLLEAVIASQTTNPFVNAVLVQLNRAPTPTRSPSRHPALEAAQASTRAPQMEEILVGKLIATSARQIGMFLVILAVVSAAIVAFIIYTLTLGKIREIAVLKLIGTRNRTIAGMILQQAVGLGADRLRGGQDRRHLLGAGLSRSTCCSAGRRGARLRRRHGSSASLASMLAIRAALRSIRRRRSVADMHRPLPADGHPHRGPAQALRQRATAVDALKGVDMQVAPGEVVGLIGPSAPARARCSSAWAPSSSPAGRMTLGGEVIYDDGWKVGDLRALRRDRIGFVFQAPYLIPFLDVTDNVALLPMLAGMPNGRGARSARSTARLLRRRSTCSTARGAMPSQLSGGEQQRVAIARRPGQPAAGDPRRRAHRAARQRARPGGDQDPQQTDGAQFETAIIVVTHDEKIIPTFKRIYHIRDGSHGPVLRRLALPVAVAVPHRVAPQRAQASVAASSEIPDAVHRQGAVLGGERTRAQPVAERHRDARLSHRVRRRQQQLDIARRRLGGPDRRREHREPPLSGTLLEARHFAVERQQLGTQVPVIVLFVACGQGGGRQREQRDEDDHGSHDTAPPRDGSRYLASL